MKNDLRLVLSVRLFTDQKCFGPGIAELLHRVEEYGSLRAAAKSMEMAYSKAWTVIHRSEECLGFPLLQSTSGGKNGGGAKLTEQGRQMLSAYDSFCDAVRSYAQKLFAETFRTSENS